MKVYLLTEGDGTDGDEMRVHAVYASQETARAEAEKRARAEWSEAQLAYHDRSSAQGYRGYHDDDWGRWQVEEWDVIP